MGLSHLVLGSRLPGFGEFSRNNSGVSAGEYLKMVGRNNLPIDPEIRFYTRAGLKPVKLVENYMEDDPQSLHYGVVMVWNNPDSNH